MKHIIFNLLVIIFVLPSCDPPSQRITNNHYITNETNKQIVHKLFIDDSLIKEDSLVFSVNGLSDSLFEWEVTCVKGNVINGGSVINYSSFVIYNITDTTSLLWKDFYRGYELNMQKLPQYFRSDNGTSVYDKNKHEDNWIVNYYLTINDSLLLLMKKDYTMLDMFKEYYKK